MDKPKSEVKDFWNQASCGEELYLYGATEQDSYRNQAAERYRLEPYILPFADFKSAAGKRVLEIGVGLGAEHQQFAEAGADLSGIDLTERAIEHTKQRLSLFNLRSNLQVADAEQLPFLDQSFDIIYSWGVIHHSPNTSEIVSEIHRVLQPGGEARIMIYHTKSIVGYMLWLRYGLMRLKPFKTLKDIYDKHLESPGTKAYTKEEARKLFNMFSDVQISTTLTHADLLTSAAGQRHRGAVLSIARKLFPRIIIRKFFPGHGLFMLIKAKK